MNTRISIIMPVYKAEKTICRAIDSILAQTSKDFELILVDDGSPDACGSICDKYAQEDSRIKVVHKENGGANSARNAALDVISSDYVTFCDADDYVDSNWVGDFLNAINGVDVVIAGVKYIINDKPDHLIFKTGTVNAVESADVMSAREAFGYLPCKCFKTSIIRVNSLRFNENFCFLEDEEFICRYWKYVETSRFIESCAYNYFVPDFSRKYRDIDGYHLYKELLESASTFIPLDSNSITLRKYMMGFFRSMMYAYQHHNYAEAWHRLKEFSSYSKDYKRHNKYMRIINQWNYILWHPFLMVYTLVKK